ncbi:MAG: carboxypeptidase-like regulatory domain-containing protein, partial [Bacteroidales bacterium]
MKNLLINLLFLLCSLPIIAGNVEGKIIDGKTKQPLDFVNVALYKAPGDKLISGVVTDAKGAFLFQNISVGNYILKVTFVGYTSLELP